MNRNTKAAAILGGGPSLPKDLARLPADCALIAVNHHAFRLCQPDFVVFMDDPLKVPELFQTLKDHAGVTKVCPFSMSDIVLPKHEWWDGGFSSTLATWFALWMGFNPVILCGMDLYQGKDKYFYEREGFYHPVFDAPIENHLRAWRKAYAHCPNPQNIRVMSGPLAEVFTPYE